QCRAQGRTSDCKRVMRAALREHCHRVAGDAKESGMAERGEADVADEQIEAHREDGEDGDAGSELEGIAGKQPGQRDEQNGDRAEAGELAAPHARPSRPEGRSTSTSAIGAKIANSENSGKSVR